VGYCKAYTPLAEQNCINREIKNYPYRPGSISVSCRRARMEFEMTEDEDCE